jgi:hypothetical protein
LALQPIPSGLSRRHSWLYEVVDDQPDASMPSNLEARKADQSSGKLLGTNGNDEQKQRYTVLTILGLANAEYDRLRGVTGGTQK